MAKIQAFPGLATIDGFKGKLDYYVHDGQACVRTWPKSPGKKRTQAVMDQWPIFAWPAANWKSLSPYVQQAYTTLASGSGLSGRDFFMRAFIKGIFPPGK